MSIRPSHSRFLSIFTLAYVALVSVFNRNRRITNSSIMMTMMMTTEVKRFSVAVMMTKVTQ